MYCSTAAADITPPPGPILQGHISATPSHCVLYPLAVRSIVFQENDDRVAIITIDALSITAQITDQIREKINAKTGIAPDNIMIATSHTHCAPAVLPCLGMKPLNEFVESIKSAAVDTTTQAAQSLQPVTLGLGCGSAYFNVNRRLLVDGQITMAPNESGIVDKRVRVLKVETNDGEPLAILFHYSCHASTLKGSDGLISPDYPGIARMGIEKSLGCNALFLPGCPADTRTAIIDNQNQFTSATPEQLTQCGNELGNETVRIANTIKTQPATDLTARTKKILIPFAPPLSDRELNKAIEDTSHPFYDLFSSWAKNVLELKHTNKLPTSITSSMQLMQIGPLTCISIPGEPVQAMGNEIEKQYRKLTKTDDTWPVGYTNDTIGYLCTTRQHEEGGYEPTAYPYYSLPAPLLDEFKIIVQTAIDLASTK